MKDSFWLGNEVLLGDSYRCTHELLHLRLYRDLCLDSCSLHDLTMILEAAQQSLD